MSTPAISVINDAAALILDPNFSRVSLATWTAILNRVQRKMCSRMDILEAEAYFNLEANEERYAYPEDATQVTEIRVTDSPTDVNSYRFLNEDVTEEWRAAVNGAYPTGTVPDFYLARKQWIYVRPKPDATIVNGGLIAFYHLPFEVVDPSIEQIEVPDLARDHLCEGMIVEAKRALNMVAEANAQYLHWIQVLEPEVKQRLEDRSQDRRPSLRPRPRPAHV